MCIRDRTNGATEAIYLIAQTFRNQISAILMPTFSEYADACRLHGHKAVSYTHLDVYKRQVGSIALTFRETFAVDTTVQIYVQPIYLP